MQRFLKIKEQEQLLQLINLKKLELMSEEMLREGFQRKDLILFTDSTTLSEFLLAEDYVDTNLLLMSSGNYDNLNLEPLKQKFLSYATQP